MSYALITLWYERSRFVPSVLAVAFSSLLIAMQCGILLGTFSVVTLPVDRSRADIWVAYPGIDSFDQNLPIPEVWRARLESQPEVAQTEVLLHGYVPWPRPNRSGVVSCQLIGTEVGDSACGAIRDLTPDLRARLGELGTVVIDDLDMDRLGITRIGDATEVLGCRVRVVGVVRGLRGLVGAYVFCSVRTARHLMRQAGLRDGQVNYLVARCNDPAAAPAVVQRLRGYPNMSAHTTAELSLKSRLHWVTTTKAGLSLGCTAVLGLLVGGAVTSQTLYAATAASQREYAVLEALGIPTWRMVAMVLTQSLWVGCLGLVPGFLAIFAGSWIFEALDNKILLPVWLLAATAALTLAMALLSGVLALRSLRLIEPTTLMR